GREGANVISDLSREPRSLNDLLRQLVQIGIVLSSERDLGVLRERIVAEARRFTNAEAGTLFLREGGALRFAVVQNEPFVQRFGTADTRARIGADRLALDLPGLASHVAKTGETLMLPDAYGGSDGRPSAFDAANRRSFMRRFEAGAKRHTLYGEPVSLVLIDVDHFKPVNDRHGHGTGDTVLREVTHVLMENSRDFSIVTRYGGDEFAVLLVNTPKVGALRYAERILGIVARHRFVHGHLTVSMGVATLPDDVRAADELIPASDRALYAAKQAGRNNIQSAAC